ncbi:hypothetical protein HK100_003130 [Physocladia obscura]|uniref:UBX domain-containing protein n=1 Tax=Physocladia obscura TaxID=109957 RepID=A0AAD5T0D8_9FUNG|nr:hypothetical protein HK100_003130 [Physocladia obscura]
MDSLTDDQLKLVGEFQAFTNIESVDTAIDWLSSHDWNLQRAVDRVYSGSSNDASATTATTPDSRTPTSPSTSAETTPSANESAITTLSDSATGTSTKEGIARRRPFVSSPSASASATTSSTKVAAIAASRVGLRTGAKPITPMWLTYCLKASIFPFNFIFRSQQQRINSASRDSQATAARFLLDYEAKHGAEHPAFFQGTYSQALEIAKRELRCLLVILQSDEHDDTPAFCRDTLASPVLLEFLGTKRFVVWGGDVKESEAFVVGNTLLATRFPFLAMIAPQASNRMVVVERFEGPIKPDALVTALQSQLNRVDNILRSVRLERERLDQSRILREQQEEAYNASLRADQEKARKAEEERELAQKEKAEEEKRQQEIANKREEKRFRKIWLQENMIPEPLASDTQDIAKVGIRLPNGDRLVRRFKATVATVQDLYNFIEAQDLSPIDLETDFDVINTYPRKVLTDKMQTIKEAGLSPSSSVMVEEVDPEDD